MSICFLSRRNILKAGVLEMPRELVQNLTMLLLEKICFSGALLNCILCHASAEVLNQSSVWLPWFSASHKCPLPCAEQGLLQRNKIFQVTLCRPQADTIQLHINRTRQRTQSTSGTSIKLGFISVAFALWIQRNQM